MVNFWIGYKLRMMRTGILHCMTKNFFNRMSSIITKESLQNIKILSLIKRQF